MHSNFKECIFFIYMLVGELTKYLDDWAPPGVAWERDNVGLLVGSSRQKVNNVMLCLELNQKVLNAALKINCNFIFTHHPLIFNPIKKLNFEIDRTSKLIEILIKNNISVYCAHTNLDSIKNGVSFELAKTIQLKNISFLELEEANQYKVVVFIPADYVDEVSNAVFKFGAGVIGEYSNCSFRLNGEGTFKGSNISKPTVGKKNKFEKVNEIRLEFIIDEWKLDNVITALLNAHPYEEPAYDIYPLKNKNVNYGAGTIGNLIKPMNKKAFLAFISKKLKIEILKYCDGKKNIINKVAVCGGAGFELINHAIDSGADAFITSDIKYHSYQDAESKILLIDAGHYNTEIFSLNSVLGKIKKVISSTDKIKVFKYSGNTNPIKFYKQ